MREIEIKARVDELESIIETLVSQGVAVTDPVTQHDVVYGAKGLTTLRFASIMSTS